MGTRHCYIGGYAKGSREGIVRATLDDESGALAIGETVGGIPSPSFLAADSSGRFIYAVNEVGRIDGEASGAVTALRRDPGDGSLELLGRVATSGKGPCHLVLSHDGHHLYTASYGSGTVGVHPIAEDGSLGALVEEHRHSGDGPHRRQDAPHAHGLWVSPDDRYVLACDLGIDQVVIYARDATGGGLTPHGTCRLAGGSGPRHLTAGPNAQHLYIVNELDNSVTATTWDAAAGSLSVIAAAATLPDGTEEPNTAAEILMSAKGHRVYVTNRGHDSIAVFKRDRHGGTLERMGHVPTGGATPRHACLVSGSDLLVCANQDADEVVVFRLGDQGIPVATGQRMSAPAPTCLLCLEA